MKHLLLLLLPVVVAIQMSDEDFERLITLGCRWAHCGPGTLMERASKLQSLVADGAAVSILLDDPAKDTWMDADGVRP